MLSLFFWIMAAGVILLTWFTTRRIDLRGTSDYEDFYFTWFMVFAVIILLRVSIG